MFVVSYFRLARGRAWRGVLLPVTLASSFAGAVFADAPATFPVGEAHRAFADPARRAWLGNGPRLLRTTVWYPAASEPDTDYNPSADGADRVRPDAPLAAEPTQLPLILVSHGSGGSTVQVRWLGVALASHGYIAVAVSHNGTDEEEMKDRLSATDFFAWERPRDLSFVLDRMLVDFGFGKRIDPGRIGAAGFSLGGTSVLWLGGMRLDLEMLRERSPAPPAFLQSSIDRLITYSVENDVGRASIARASRSYRDRRVRAIVALAPAMGPGFPPAGLRTCHVPVLIVAGDADKIAPPAENAAYFAKNIPQARLVVLPGERGHYTQDIPAAQREAELAEVSARAVTFFDETLGAFTRSD